MFCPTEARNPALALARPAKPRKPSAHPARRGHVTALQSRGRGLIRGQSPWGERREGEAREVRGGVTQGELVLSTQVLTFAENCDSRLPPSFESWNFPALYLDFLRLTHTSRLNQHPVPVASCPHGGGNAGPKARNRFARFSGDHVFKAKRE